MWTRYFPSQTEIMIKLIFLLPILLYSQIIDTVIPLFDEPREQLLYIPEGNKLYINFDQTNRLLVLDCSTYTIKKIISIPADYPSAAFGIWNRRRNKIYYTFNPWPDSIVVIDNQTDSIIKFINFEAYWPPCYNSIEDKIYAVAGNSLAVINCETDSIIKIISQSYNLSRFVLWDSIGNKVYCGSGLACDEVTVINCENDSIIAVISTGVSTPCAAVYNPERRKLYVAGAWGLRGAVIDAVNDSLIKNFDIDFADEIELPLLYNNFEDKVYWSGYDSIYVISCQNDTIIKSIRIIPWCMRIGSWRNRLYTTIDTIINNQWVNMLKIIDCSNDSIVSELIFGKISIAMTLNPKDKKIYIVTHNDSMLYVINDDILGVEEILKINTERLEPEIYPNPVKSVLLVRCPLSVKEIKIFDVSGKLVKKEKVTSEQENKQEVRISLKDINPGIYFLRLGKQTKKFLVVE